MNKKIFYKDESPYYPGKYLIRANLDPFKLKSTQGSFAVIGARLFGISYADYLRMCRTPKETLADGTYDRVWAFVRKHNIRIHEWQEIEENIQLYNEKYLK
mgnify:CR=1 FL=1